jgi:hypothetical protein
MPRTQDTRCLSLCETAPSKDGTQGPRGSAVWIWAQHFALNTSFTKAKSSMAPPPQTYNSVLSRTIQNLEQAQGIEVYHATMSDIFHADDTEQADVISLPSTSDENANTPPPSVGSEEAVLASNGLATVDLISDLNCSTALLRNLRARNSILTADLARANTSLILHEEKLSGILLIESRRRVRWMATAAFTFALWTAYLLWCWYMRVEFEYIRKRRREVFGL